MGGPRGRVRSRAIIATEGLILIGQSVVSADQFRGLRTE